MKKRKLQKTFETSIMAVNISTRGLYEKYYPLISDELNFFGNKLDFDISDKFSSRTAWDIFIRSADVELIEKELKNLISNLRANAMHSPANAVPTGVEQAKMRLRLENRMGTIILTLPQESPLRECLSSAKHDLEGMVFPKNDSNVLQCYLLLMETLDDIDTTDEAVTISRITNLINQWKSLRM